MSKSGVSQPRFKAPSSNSGMSLADQCYIRALPAGRQLRQLHQMRLAALVQLCITVSSPRRALGARASSSWIVRAAGSRALHDGHASIFAMEADSMARPERLRSPSTILRNPS